jgi:hypothetical protein
MTLSAWVRRTDRIAGRGGVDPPRPCCERDGTMSSNPLPSVITRRDIARLRILAELNAAGPLDFVALVRKLGRDPAFQSEMPLDTLLRSLEAEGLVSTNGGRPRRYCLRLVGRIEFHALIQAVSVELARKLSHRPTSPRPARGAELTGTRTRCTNPTSPLSALGSAHPPRAPPRATSETSSRVREAWAIPTPLTAFSSETPMRFQCSGVRLVSHDQPRDLRRSRAADCHSGRTAPCRIASFGTAPANRVDATDPSVSRCRVGHARTATLAGHRRTASSN